MFVGCILFAEQMCQYKVDYMTSFNFWSLVVKISLTSLIVVVTALVSVITICGIKNQALFRTEQIKLL